MSNKTIFFITLLIIGNMIGAGILAMPIVAGIAGLLPSILAMFFFSSSMLFSGLVITREINEVKRSSFNLPSLYQKHFGISGKWISSLVNIFIFYGVLTSYLAGATKLIIVLFNIDASLEPLILIILFFILTTIAISSITIIERYNTFFMTLLTISFLILIILGSSSIEVSRLSHIDWQYVPLAIPMIVAGFVFHYILPSICKIALWNSEIYKPILIGVGITLFINILWLIVGIGVVSEFGHISLNEARITGVPITVEMSQILNSKIFLITGSIFALVAITTSYVSIGMALKDFLNDIFENSFHLYSKYLIIIVAFVPPLLISYFYANIFLKALNIVAGIGVVFLLGILPSYISFKRNDSKFEKVLSIVFFIAFSATLVITLLQTLGITHILPTKG